MIPETYKAYYVDESLYGSVVEVPTSNLPENEVTIDVYYSSLNYKDALSARGLNRVTKTYPHVPGIDAVGKVISDTSGTYSIDDWVIVTGNDLGTNTFGGFGGIIRVPSEWVVKKPDNLSPKQSMAIGTAGFTSLYGIHRLKQVNITPNSGKVLVTGATGGVGSFAVFALSQLGYDVLASSRKDNKPFLHSLGANEIIHSSELVPDKNRPLQPRKWSGCIETVGGSILDAVLTQTAPKGAVGCCGNILGIELSTNVLPFILRGISLLGIDSAFCIRSIREEIWELASSLDYSQLPTNYSKVIKLEDINPEIDKILEGGQTGRVVISHK
jgi:putative YhdH/YhfP family quinone oxidoreductase